MASTIVTVYGRRTCACVKRALPLVEARLKRAGYIKQDLSGLITQGGYNNGAVSASAGTHDGGGVIDVKPSLVDTEAKRKIWRQSGWAMWHRRTWEGNWPEHGHGVLIGCPHASAGAKRQVTAYKAGRNGLANNGADQGPRVTILTWEQALAASKIHKTSVARLLANAKSKAPRAKSNDVLRLQRLLRNAGCMSTPAIMLERGKYGPRTRAAVRKAQLKAGFRGGDADGYIGISTLTWLAKRAKGTSVETKAVA